MPSPTVVELIGINGKFEGISAPLDGEGILKGTVHLIGQLNSRHEGSLEIGGSFAKKGNDVDFDLELSLGHVNLTSFSPYYSQTSFTILKEASLNRASAEPTAACAT